MNSLDTQDRSDTGAGWGSVSYVTLLVIAAILYLCTDSLIGAVAVPCLHGGRHSLNTGLWLLRTDPDRRRARVSFLFYLACASLISAVTAMLTTCACLFIEDRLKVPFNQNELIASTVVLVGGLLLNMFFGLIACIAAAMLRVRVWIHPRLREMVRSDRGLIEDLNPLGSRANYAVAVVSAAAASVSSIVGITYFVLTTHGRVPGQMGNRNGLDPIVMVLLGIAIGGVLAYVPLSALVIASTPQQYWNQTPRGRR